jgi:DNA-binding response OmpR family regulator
MPETEIRILVIGTHSFATGNILKHLLRRGWGSRSVGTLREARAEMETFRFDIVLANEMVADGRGYDVSDRVVYQSGTLIVAIALSETSLWLPVIELGKSVLGRRALNTTTLEAEVEMLLSSHDRKAVTMRKRFQTLEPRRAPGPQSGLCAADSRRVSSDTGSR